MSVALMFYTVFTLVYGLGHWLIYRQATAAFKPHGLARGLLLAFLIWGALSPVIQGMIIRQPGLWAWATYIWLGLAFYLFLGSYISLILRLFRARTAANIWFICTIGLSLALVGYGLMDARRVVIRQLSFETSRLATTDDPLNIVVLSDLHLGSIEPLGRLKRVLGAFDPAKIDMLVCTGDIIDSGLEAADWPEAARLLARLQPPLGKWAIYGNHEHITDRALAAPFSKSFYKAAGIRLINDASVDLGPVRLVGLEDSRFSREARSVDRILMSMLPQGPRPFTIVLRHQPLVVPEALGRFDLQLSGHTHRGQMWPFRYVVAAIYDYVYGRFDLGQGSRLYVTTGAGTWGPPVRVGASPEVVMIKLKPKI